MNNSLFAALLGIGCAGIAVSFVRARSRGLLLQDGLSDPPRRLVAVGLLGAVLLLTVAIPFAGGLAGNAPERKNLTVISLFAVHFVLLVFLALYYALTRRTSLAEFLKLRSARPAADLRAGLWIGLAGWFLMMVVLSALVLVWYMLRQPGVGPVAPGGINPTIRWIVSQSIAIRIAIVLSAMVVEELFFRSFLQTRVGPLAATLMFTAAHGAYGQPLVLVGILVISAVLSATFVLYGNVLPCIVAHGVFDAIQMFVLIPIGLSQVGG